MRSFLTKANEDRGKERYRRASITATSSLISQGLTILISLISVPLTVGYLGPERYGVWLTMSSLLTWMAMTDFGLAGNALVNVIAEATGRDDRQLARQYAASAFWSLTAITLTMGTIAFITFRWIPWRAIFRVSTVVSTQELQAACALALAVFVLVLPLNMLNSVYSACQDGYIANAWTIASSALALVSLIVVTQFHGGLPQLILALSGSRMIVGVASGYYLFFHRYPWLAPYPSAVGWVQIKRLLRLGGKYMLGQLASLGIYQSQPIIITQLLNPSQVLIFVVTQKIITLPVNLVYMANNPLLSAYSEARARGDWNWIKGALKKSLVASAIFGLVSSALICLVAKPFIRVWAGPAAVPDSALILFLGIYTVFGIVPIPTGSMLSGMERVGRLSVTQVFCAIATVGLSIVLGKFWGLTGIAVAMSAAIVLILVPAHAYEIHRAFSAFRHEAPEGDRYGKAVA
jgi:O-antigen/teichoic acid export membrane protein